MKYSALEQQYVLSNGRTVKRIELLVFEGQMPIDIRPYPYGELSQGEYLEVVLWLIEALAHNANPTPEVDASPLL
jgi:hypothetical protein